MKSINTLSELDNLLESSKPILLDFYADWCGPCQALLPTVEKLASEYEDKAEIVKINVDQAQELAVKFGVRSIPTLIFFKNKENVDRLAGLQPENVLKEKLESLI
jgi:thioredoxin 1